MGPDLNGLRAAVAFLTRIPMGDVSEDSLRMAPGWFPTVGGLIGLAVAGAYTISIEIVPVLLAAVIGVTFGLFLTGGLHEDGLADTADAIGSGAEGNRALEIMKDSRLGTYGTLALIISMLWKVAAVASLAPLSALATLVLAGSLGRAGTVVLMGVTSPAHPDGIGKTMVPSSLSMMAAIVSGLVIGLVSVGWWLVPAAALTAIVVLGVRFAATRRVGGVTGDILGACEQLIELVLLAVGVVAFADVAPWWV